MDIFQEDSQARPDSSPAAKSWAGWLARRGRLALPLLLLAVTLLLAGCGHGGY